MTIQLGVAIALSLSAGLIALVGGLRMRKWVGDPLFTERLFAHRVTMIYFYLFLIIVAAVAARKAALGVAAIAFLSIAIGGFPARKTLYGETWTLTQYLVNRIRLIAFAGGPWIAILIAPHALAVAGLQWAPLVFLVVLTLFVYQQQLLLFGVAAKPLQDEPLMRLLEPILERTEAPRPAIFVGGSETGRFANAAALPDGKRSRIVLTRALLRELEPLEVAAIFAHEAAHLEQYANRGVRIRMWIGRVLLPLLAVAPQTMLLMKAPQAAKWMAVVWPFLFLMMIMTALVRRQAHESEADLRALKLGADPHALINGLEKLHRLLATPRRFDAPREKRMTHPSLARRIQAIRKVSGIEVGPPPALPRIVAARKKGTFIRFTAEALEVFYREPGDATPPTRAWRYDAMQSLLVQQTLRGWELMGRSGKERIRLPMAAESAAEVQEVLDSIDVHFAETATKPQIARSARLTAVLLLLMSLLPGISFPPLIASLISLISAGAPALAAAGTTAIAAGLLAFTRPSMPFLEDVIPVFAAAEILIGLICLLLVRKIPAEQRRRHLRATLIILGAFTAIVLLPSLMSMMFGQPLVRLFMIARERPSAAILLLGIAAALAVSGRRRTASATAIAAMAFLIFGTRTVGLLIGSDPLLTNRQPKWVSPPSPSAVRKLDGMPTTLRLSPDGRAFAVRLTDEEEEDRAKFAVATLESGMNEVNATDLSFAGSDRLLRIENKEASLQLDSIDIAGKPDGWKVELPQLWQPELSAGRNGEWVVSGRTVSNYRLSRMSGRIGAPGYVSNVMKGPAVPALFSPAVGENGVVYATMVMPSRVASPWLLMLSPGGTGAEFWRVRGGAPESIGRSALHPAATLWLPDAGRWVIAGYDERSTYVGTIDETAKMVRPSGAINERASRIRAGRGSRIAMHSHSAAVVWNLATGKAMRLSCSDCIVLDTALTDDAAGVLLVRGQTTSLELYPTKSLNE